MDFGPKSLHFIVLDTFLHGRSANDHITCTFTLFRQLGSGRDCHPPQSTRKHTDPAGPKHKIKAFKGEARKNNCRCLRGYSEFAKNALHGCAKRLVMSIQRAGILGLVALDANCWAAASRGSIALSRTHDQSRDGLQSSRMGPQRRVLPAR